MRAGKRVSPTGRALHPFTSPPMAPVQGILLYLPGFCQRLDRVFHPTPSVVLVMGMLPQDGSGSILSPGMSAVLKMLCVYSCVDLCLCACLDVWAVYKREWVWMWEKKVECPGTFTLHLIPSKQAFSLGVQLAANKTSNTPISCPDHYSHSSRCSCNYI